MSTPSKKNMEKLVIINTRYKDWGYITPLQ